MAKYIASTVTYDSTGKVIDTWDGNDLNILDDSSKENSLKMAVEWEAEALREYNDDVENVTIDGDTVYYTKDGEQFRLVVSVDEL